MMSLRLFAVVCIVAVSSPAFAQAIDYDNPNNFGQ